MSRPKGCTPTLTPPSQAKCALRCARHVAAHAELDEPKKPRGHTQARVQDDPDGSSRRGERPGMRGQGVRRRAARRIVCQQYHGREKAAAKAGDDRPALPQAGVRRRRVSGSAPGKAQGLIYQARGLGAWKRRRDRLQAATTARAAAASRRAPAHPPRPILT